MATHLTRNEERTLIRRYQRTLDPRLEARLVRSQLALVAQHARRHHADGVDVRDLIQEGAVGLLLAIRRFDLNRGVRLSTYAGWWIRAFQYRFLLQNHRLVRIGTTQQQRRIYFRLNALRARLSAAGLEPTPEQIARLLGVDLETLRQMEPRLASREQSLDAPQRAGRYETPIELLAGHDVAADELIADQELCAIVRSERDRYRASLPGRRRALFDARWLSDNPPSLQEMGNRFGVTRERARQLEQKMLNELRRRVRARIASPAAAPP
jgi:RNA polymerase sigma-32 factor